VQSKTGRKPAYFTPHAGSRCIMEKLKENHKPRYTKYTSNPISTVSTTRLLKEHGSPVSMLVMVKVDPNGPLT